MNRTASFTIVMVVIIVLLLVVITFYAADESATSTSSTTSSTYSVGENHTTALDRTNFNQYGFSIDRPVGAITSIGQGSDAQGGTIIWLWNGNATSLYVFWYNNSFLSARLWFSAALNNSKEGTEVSSGNISINGIRWPFETIHFSRDSFGSSYETIIAKQDFSEGRFFAIQFVDSENDTLAQLQYWTQTLS